MDKLEIGTTVELKSGGPLMTVIGYDMAGHAQCVWFPADMIEPKRSSFPTESLVRVKGAY